MCCTNNFFSYILFNLIKLKKPPPQKKNTEKKEKKKKKNKRNNLNCFAEALICDYN